MATGVIGKIKPGAGPVAAMPRRAPPSSTTGPASADEAYAATLRQPRTSLIAQVVRTVATGRQPSNWWHCVGLVKLATVGDRPADGRQPDVLAHFKLWRRTNSQDDRAESSGRALWPRCSAASFRIGIRHAAQEQDRAGAGVPDQKYERPVNRHLNGLFAGT